MEIRNSKKAVSQNAAVTRVHGYQKLLPGTMTSHGNATALSDRLNEMT